jgi:hypothetical protein
LFGSGGSVGNVVLHIAMPYVLDENDKIYLERIKLVVFEMNKNMALASYELLFSAISVVSECRFLSLCFKTGIMTS